MEHGPWSDMLYSRNFLLNIRRWMVDVNKTYKRTFVSIHNEDLNIQVSCNPDWNAIEEKFRAKIAKLEGKPLPEDTEEQNDKEQTDKEIEENK